MTNVIYMKIWKEEKAKKKAAIQVSRPYVYFKDKRTQAEKWKAYFDWMKEADIIAFPLKKKKK